MTNTTYEITVSDPGQGNRLGSNERMTLQSQIRQADRSDAAAVLISVADDAWHQDAVGDTAVLSARQVSKDYHRLVTALFSLQKPVVAQLIGRVSGLGLGLALACDTRFGTDRTSFSVGSPETAHGLLGGTSWLLAQRAGAAVVAHLSWTGRALSADEAVALSLLSGLSPDGSAAREMVERLAHMPDGACSALKRSLNGRLLGELEQQLDYDSWLATVALRAGK